MLNLLAVGMPLFYENRFSYTNNLAVLFAGTKYIAYKVYVFAFRFIGSSLVFLRQFGELVEVC